MVGEVAALVMLEAGAGGLSGFVSGIKNGATFGTSRRNGTFYRFLLI